MNSRAKTSRAMVLLLLGLATAISLPVPIQFGGEDAAF
jgi:hypothetical protein